MVSLQINGNTSNRAHFYASLFHLVISCLLRHVPGLPAQVRLKRPIPSTKGNEMLLLGWKVCLFPPDDGYVYVVLLW